MLAGAAKRNIESINHAENFITEHYAVCHKFTLKNIHIFAQKRLKRV